MSPRKGSEGCSPPPYMVSQLLSSLQKLGEPKCLHPPVRNLPLPQMPIPVHAEIRDLEKRRYDAVLSQNFETLADLCHADLIYGHSGGNRDTLDQYLGKLRTGALRYEYID